MFTQRLYRSLGLAAHLGWARFLVDRYRDLVEADSKRRQQQSFCTFRYVFCWGFWS
jgi:hypothetical protein